MGAGSRKYAERRMEVLHSLINECGPESKVIYDLGASSTNAISNGIKTKSTVKFDIMDDKHPDVVIDLNEKIPMPSDSADICIAGEMIEHLYHANNFLKEVRRVLKKDGYLFLTVPNACCIKSRFLMLFGHLGSNLAKADEQNEKATIRKGEGHVRDFNQKEIKNLLLKNGFRVDRIATTGIAAKSVFISARLIPKTFGDDIIVMARIEK